MRRSSACSTCAARDQTAAGALQRESSAATEGWGALDDGVVRQRLLLPLRRDRGLPVDALSQSPRVSAHLPSGSAWRSRQQRTHELGHEAVDDAEEAHALVEIAVDHLLEAREAERRPAQREPDERSWRSPSSVPAPHQSECASMTKDPSSPFFPSSEVTSNFTRSVSASALEAAAASSTAAKAALRISLSLFPSPEDSWRSAPLSARATQLSSGYMHGRGACSTGAAERKRGRR